MPRYRYAGVEAVHQLFLPRVLSLELGCFLFFIMNPMDAPSRKIRKVPLLVLFDPEYIQPFRRKLTETSSRQRLSLSL